MKHFLVIGVIVFYCSVLFGVSKPVEAEMPDARMLRFPDVSGENIVFVYAGDMWVVPKGGGMARRLSSPSGHEQFPKFSPDGRRIAFSGNYDGNTDVYVMPTEGGEPERLTHHPSSDMVVEWYPDGQNILYRSGMVSPSRRFNRFFKQSIEGGLPDVLDLPYGELASFSSDGGRMAFQYIDRQGRTWKRYRGGMASDIWLYNFADGTTEQITDFIGTDALPMWHKDTIYFLSDRGEKNKLNIWAYGLKTKKFRQVTEFDEYDVKWPSPGPKDIVFENGGKLYLLAMATEKSRGVSIQVPADLPKVRKKLKNVSGHIRNFSLSPSGKRALFNARGEIFTVPEKHGSVRNLTNSCGVAERFSTWSPDGKQVAYFSDRTGEYELYIRAGDGKGEEKQITCDGEVFRYRPLWSPDSESIAFSDKTGSLFIVKVEDGEPVFVDKDERSFIDSYSWSSDSRWLTYSKGMENYHHAIMIYDTVEKESRQVTSDFYHNTSPVFDTEGKYLFFRSERTFRPVYGNMDQTWIYPNSTNLYVATLRDDVESPLAPRSDEEGIEDEDKDKDKDKNGEEDDDEDDEDDDEDEEGDDEDEEGDDEDDDKDKDEDDDKDKDEDGDKDKDEDKDDDDNEEDGDEECDEVDDPNAVKKSCEDPNDVSDDEDEEEKVEIDFENFERRVIKLGVDSGNIRSLSTVKGKLLYLRNPAEGSRGGSTSLHYYDMKERKEEKIISDVSGYYVSAKGKKLIYRSGTTYGIIDIGKGKKVGDGKIAANNLKAWINPRQEWQQMFVEAWRIERDYFYDPTMHGLDWDAIRARYEPLLRYVVDRNDLNYVIGEMIGELNCSHAYISGGDMESAERISVGLLGSDFELDEQNDVYRIKKIYEGAVWDAAARSPLHEPGVEVEEGDYLLAVNGLALDTEEDPWASFQGLAGEVVSLTINSEPNMTNVKEILVKPISSESRLRNLSWIEDNRRKVEEATDGRVGYIYVPDTGVNGQNELVRQFGGQIRKEALIIDERFNAGGQIPDRFIELLNRPLYNYWALRDFKDWRTPSISHVGPKVMLINSWAGSGGDAFPYYFRKAGLGPLVGTRTWGGLVGISHNPRFIDGGRVTAPRFAFWNTEGDWDVEGYGITPDFEVKNIPAKVEEGKDEQLEKAIEVVLELLQEEPPIKPDRPDYPDRSGTVE